MDDIEIGINVFVASAHQDYDYKLTTRNKCWTILHIMSTLQLQMLFRKHDNNHCAMHYKHWYICMVLVLKNIYLLRLSKPTKSQWWNYVLFLSKTAIARFWKLSSYLIIFKNIQILGSLIDGGQKWFDFQENIIHIMMWPFTQLPIKRHLALKLT
jgi:hypothetical protein